MNDSLSNFLNDSIFFIQGLQPELYIQQQIAQQSAQQPLWVLLIILTAIVTYRDIIKPLALRIIEKKEALDIKLKEEETAAKIKKETVIKYNMEEERWKNLNDLLTILVSSNSKLTNSIENLLNNKTNCIDSTLAENIIIIAFSNSMNELITNVHRIFKFNNRLDELRQKHIRNSFEKDIDLNLLDTKRILSSVYYNDRPLSLYLESVTKEHTNDFRDLLFASIFAEGDSQKVIEDVINLIKSHYRAHIAEALTYINKVNE